MLEIDLRGKDMPNSGQGVLAGYPATYEGVLAVRDRLMGPDGCPWDRQQTPLSMRDMLREECHELLDAMASGSRADIVEEMGDALLHLVFQIKFGSDSADGGGRFTQAAAIGGAMARLRRQGELARVGDYDATSAADLLDSREWRGQDSGVDGDADASFAGLWALVGELFGAGGSLSGMDASGDAVAGLLRRACYGLTESVDPIDGGGERAVGDAVGDALFALALAMRQAQARGDFAPSDVFGGLIAKLVRRHPHVFGDTQVSDTGEVLSNWHAIKRAEKPADASALDGAPKSLPALAYAQAIQARAARVGFDWREYPQVAAKALEEAAELARAATAAERSAEYGDLLFSLVNAARWLEVDAESALRKRGRQMYRKFSVGSEGAGCVADEQARRDLERANAPGASEALRFAQILGDAMAVQSDAMLTPREIAERARAAEGLAQDAAEIEVSRLLWAAARTGGALGLDAEVALRGANERFYGRFTAMERACRRRGTRLEELALEEQEALWQAAKAEERNG